MKNQFIHVSHLEDLRLEEKDICRCMCEATIKASAYNLAVKELNVKIDKLIIKGTDEDN